MKNESLNCATCTFKHSAVLTLNNTETELLANSIVSVNFEKGERLFKENTLNSHIVYIRKGLVKLHLQISDQKDHILKIATAPNYLGLSTIFGNFINQYSATALEPTEACIIDIASFKQLLNQNGAFAYSIMSDICKDELYNFKWYVNLSHKNTDGRLAGALLYFAEKVYHNRTFELALSRNEIAELIGISRENVTRTLTRFKEEKFIDVQKNKISILNMDAINKINQGA